MKSQLMFASGMKSQSQMSNWKTRDEWEMRGMWTRTSMIIRTLAERREETAGKEAEGGGRKK